MSVNLDSTDSESSSGDSVYSESSSGDSNSDESETKNGKDSSFGKEEFEYDNPMFSSKSIDRKSN